MPHHVFGPRPSVRLCHKIRLARRRRRSDDLPHVVNLFDPPKHIGQTRVSVRRTDRRKLRELASDRRPEDAPGCRAKVDLRFMQPAVGRAMSSDRADRREGSG
jgi:hypothetical protein